MQRRRRLQTVGPYELILDTVGERTGPNYREIVAPMTVRSGGVVVAAIEPARRQFATRQMATTQAGIATLGFGQVYVSIGDPERRRAVPARLYWKPLVTLIWLGACVMALGGALSLADRRLRFGAPARGASPPPRRPQPAALIDEDARALAASSCRRRWRRARRLRGAARRDDDGPGARGARARRCRRELRCMVCQNQSIDDSDAPLARDIRLLIRERIAKGESNDAVRAFLVSRYGDFILLKPPFEAGDAAAVAERAADAGARRAGDLARATRRAREPTPALSAEEEERLAEVTRDDRGTRGPLAE